MNFITNSILLQHNKKFLLMEELGAIVGNVKILIVKIFRTWKIIDTKENLNLVIDIRLILKRLILKVMEALIPIQLLYVPH